MNLEEFKTAWQKENNMNEVTFEQLRDSAKKTSAKFEKQILSRDIVETLAALFVFVFFGRLLLGDHTLISRLGILLILAGAMEIIFTLHWMRRKNPVTPEGVPLTEYLANEIKRIDRQIWLLRNITWWYIAPVIGGACFMVLGDTESLVLSLSMCAFFIAFGYFIYWLNQRAANSHLMLLKKSLEEMQQELNNLQDAEVP